MGISQNFVSVSRRPPDVEDYIDMLRRHRSWIIGPMFAGLVISTVVAFLWHDTFVSIALMQIRPQVISQRFVPAEANSQMAQRVQDMETQILSHTSLEALIKMPTLDLYRKELQTRPMEDVVQDMRKDIHIQMSNTQSGDRTGASAFYITFQYDNPFKAQQVVQKLTSKFMEGNQQEQRKTAQVTGTFLDEERNQAKDRLDALDAELTKFKMANPGKLPEEFQSNIASINSFQNENSRISAELDHARSQKMLLEQNLKNLMDQQSFYENNVESIISTSPQAQAAQNQQLADTSSKLNSLKSTLAGLRKAHGENYPVIADLLAQIQVLQQIKDDLEKEQSQKDAAPSTAPITTRVVNPQIRTLLVSLKGQIELAKTNIRETELDIARLTKQQEEENRKIAEYQTRIDSAPVVQQRYAELTRDYTLATAEYQDKVKKKELSDTSQNLEEHQAGEQLGVLDSASFPEKPTQPNRPQWAGIGTAVGLMLGIVLAGGKEMKDTSLKNLKDVRAYTNLPVLSSIPLLENALLVRRKRRLFWLAWSTAFVFGTLVMSGSAYYYYFTTH